MFLAINWKGKSEIDPREGWVVQPCERVRRGHWRCEKSIAGPFRTQKAARSAKRFLETIEWQENTSWNAR